MSIKLSGNRRVSNHHARMLAASQIMFGLFLSCAEEAPESPTKTTDTAAQSVTVTNEAGREILQADSLVGRAQTFSNSARYDSAIHNYERAAAIYQRLAAQKDDEDVWQKYVSCYNSIGFAHSRNANFAAAQQALDLALKTGIAKFTENHLRVAASYNNFGVLYYFKGDFDHSIDNFKKSLEIRRLILGEEHPEVAQSLSNIATIYYHGNGDYDLALEYYHRALALHEKLSERALLAEASIHNNLGIAYTDKGEYESALRHHHQALRLQHDEMRPRNHPDLAASYANLGHAYIYTKDYDQAIQNLLQALAIYQSIFDRDHPDLVKARLNLAQAQYESGLYDRAHEQLLAALESARRLFGMNNPEVGACYYNLGRLYAGRRRYEEALAQYEHAARALVLSYDSAIPYVNPPLPDILSEIYLIRVWQAQGEAHAEQAAHSRNHAARQAQLEAALARFEQGLDLIDSMRTSYKSEGSKFFVGAKNFALYEKAIATALRLHAMCPESLFNHRAFEYAERAKAGVLRQAWQEARARRFAGVPDSLLRLEKEIKIDLAKYHTEILRLRQAGGDSAQRKSWESEFFSRRRRYEALLGDIEAKHPKYYELKYQSMPVTAKDLQGWLDDHNVVLEYFMGDSAIYLFTIGRDQFEARRLSAGPDFSEQAGTMLHALKTSNFAEYTASAFQIYSTLVAPSAATLAGKNLLIIPDGTLNSIPFEALLTRATPANGGVMAYDSLAYLLREHAMSYSHSASLLRPSRAEPDGERSSELLAFAPIFPHGVSLQSTDRKDWQAQASEISILRNGTGHLPDTRNEVEGIAGLFQRHQSLWARWFSAPPAKLMLASEASEHNLKAQKLARFRFLHFATHGLLNQELPDLSGILFADDPASSEDGILHAGEIYPLELNADLVVLSACETGAGKLVRGEGLVGLAHAFLYAGAQNLLASLWQVNDASTTRLMLSFYEGVLSGQSQAEALRRAKLGLIANASNSKFAMPQYWAPFVLIGSGGW